MSQCMILNQQAKKNNIITGQLIKNLPNIRELELMPLKWFSEIIPSNLFIGGIKFIIRLSMYSLIFWILLKKLEYSNETERWNEVLLEKDSSWRDDDLFSLVTYFDYIIVFF